MLFGNSVVVFFDLGGTHSFVSNECVRRIELDLRADCCDTNVWRGIHHFCLCGMPYGSGRPQVQGESHLLADGGSGRDSGDGLAISQPYCY